MLGLARVALLTEPRSDVGQRALAQAHGEYLGDETEVLAVRTEVVCPVFVVAMLAVAPCVFAF